MKPLVTIITVAYNCEKSISHAIESVLNQTYSPIEYIIVDGASTDNTLSVAQKYKEAFSSRNINYTIISEPDSGMYDALNKGVRLAKGSLIGNVNSDDWYESTAVETMVSLYEKSPYDLAWGSINVHTNSGIKVKKARLSRIWTTSGFCHPGMFGTKDTEMAFPYACLDIDDDFDMVTRVYLAGRKIAVTDSIVSNYVFGGMSTKKSVRKMIKRIKMKYTTYRRNGMSPLYWFYCVAMEVYKYMIG